MISMKYIFPLSEESLHRIRFFPEFSDGKKANKQSHHRNRDSSGNICCTNLPMVHFPPMALAADIEMKRRKAGNAHQITQQLTIVLLMIFYENVCRDEI